MSLKNTNARDIDQLQMKPIKFVIDLLLPVLWHIFILYLSTGQYLKNMQLAKVSVLFTFGDRNEFSNCRRISILPIITKGLEKNICRRTASFCEKFSIISPQQFDFPQRNVNRASITDAKRIGTERL